MTEEKKKRERNVAKDELRLRYEQCLKYSIALQRAIEVHCSGKHVDERQCPHHAKMLNARLKEIKSAEKKGGSDGTHASTEC